MRVEEEAEVPDSQNMPVRDAVVLLPSTQNGYMLGPRKYRPDAAGLIHGSPNSSSSQVQSAPVVELPTRTGRPV